MLGIVTQVKKISRQLILMIVCSGESIKLVAYEEKGVGLPWGTWN